MLRHKTFQNKIAVSRFSLPVTATLIAMIWVAVGLVQGDIWTELAFALASTLLMVELNNRNALMRTYSRMVSCSFLTLITATTLPEPSLGANVMILCFIAFILLIWNCYQDRLSTGRTFYAFICMGIASMEFVQALYYLPFMWVMMLFFVNSFSLRNLAASLLGIITPYWFAAGFFLYTGNIDYIIAHFSQFVTFHPLFDYSMITIHQVVNLSFITLLAIIGTIHFLRTSYADKIRTRMIYESLIMLDIVSLLFLVLQPQHEYELEGVMIVCTAPLIAHYITFTKGKLPNITFITILVTTVLLLLYNILLPPVMLL